MAFSCTVGTSGFICASCVCPSSSSAPAGYVFLSALCLYLHPKMTEWHHWKAFLPFQTCLSINQEYSEIKTHLSRPCTCVQPRVHWLLTNKPLAWTAIVTRNFPENAVCWRRNTQLADGERLLVNTIWLLEIRAVSARERWTWIRAAESGTSDMFNSKKVMSFPSKTEITFAGQNTQTRTLFSVSDLAVTWAVESAAGFCALSHPGVCGRCHLFEGFHIRRAARAKTLEITDRRSQTVT